MKKILLVVIMAAFTASATDHFVRTSSAGSANGTSWANAWSMSGISWGSVAAGDTIYVAGGTYSTSLSFGASGSAGNQITVKRASASIAACTGSSGWSSAFDALVVIPGTINCNGYSCITLDGSVNKGIQIPFGGSSPNGGNSGYGICFSAVGAGAAPNQSQIFTNLWLKGPGWGNVSNVKGMLTGGTKCLQLNKVISHCTFDGVIQPLDAELWYNAVVDHCTFLDTGGNTSSSYQHADWCYHWSGTNTVFQHNYATNLTSQGFTFYYASDGNTWFIGNVLDVGNRPLAGGEQGQWTGSGGGYSGYWGNLFLVNNVFIGGGGFRFDDNVAQGGSGPNHLYKWNNIFLGGTDTDREKGSPPLTQDYNIYTSGGNQDGGAHSFTSTGSALFVDPSSNWRLKSGSPAMNAALAIGTTNANSNPNIATPVNVDPDGNVRGADGVWDIGAYEYVGAGGNPPVVTSQPQNTSAEVGGTFSLSLTASGSPTLAYQWYAQSNGVAGCAISGATSAGYSKSNAQLTDTTNYCCVVTNTYGAITSSVVFVTVTNGTTPVISASVPSINFGKQFTNTATSITFWFTNTGSGTASGTVSANGQWTITAGSSISLTAGSAQSSTVTWTPTIQGQTNGTISIGSYATIPVSGIALKIFGSTAYLTNGVVISPTVKASDSIYGTSDFSSTVQGTGETLIGMTNPTANNVFYFTVSCETTNDGNNSVYWQLGAEPTDQTTVFDSTNVHAYGAGLISEVLTMRGPGGTYLSNQYSPATFTISANGPFWLSFRDREPYFRIASVTMVSTAPAVIITQPPNITATAGGTATFSVGASGTVPLSYQWKWYGTNVTGATSSTWTTPVLASGNDASSVSVSVSNTYGTATSQTATLSVQLPVSTGTISVDTMNINNLNVVH